MIHGSWEDTLTCLSGSLDSTRQEWGWRAEVRRGRRHFLELFRLKRPFLPHKMKERRTRTAQNEMEMESSNSFFFEAKRCKPSDGSKAMYQKRIRSRDRKNDTHGYEARNFRQISFSKTTLFQRRRVTHPSSASSRLILMPWLSNLLPEMLVWLSCLLRLDMSSQVWLHDCMSNSLETQFLSLSVTFLSVLLQFLSKKCKLTKS